DRAWADGQRQGQGIKGVLKLFLRRYIFPHSAIAALRLVVVAGQHRPAGGDYNKPSTDLHDRKRNAEKGEDVRSYKARTNQKEKTVHSDAARKGPPRVMGVIGCKCQKNGAPAQGIDDGKECAED